jgi:hypothetical protein
MPKVCARLSDNESPDAYPVGCIVPEQVLNETRRGAFPAFSLGPCRVLVSAYLGISGHPACVVRSQ